METQKIEKGPRQIALETYAKENGLTLKTIFQITRNQKKIYYACRIDIVENEGFSDENGPIYGAESSDTAFESIETASLVLYQKMKYLIETTEKQ